VHWFAEAGRLAFADRALYLGDPGFVNVPVQGLTDPGYLKSRAALVSPDKSMGRAQPGDPPFQKSQRLAPVDGIENGTSHIAVVDAQGNAVAMTTTIEDGFGARLMTRSGFLLNNELTDFNFSPLDDGKPAANRVEAGKRPRSSMAPTIVFDAFGRLYLVTGSRRAAARSSATWRRPSSRCSTGRWTRRPRLTCRTSAAATARPSSRRALRRKAGGRRLRQRGTRCA
jgi:gamma-glutamyltranspeptidase / glutathione hydrolase